MEKKDLIKKIARATKTSKATCESIVDSFIEEIKSCLINGDKLILRGFMTFEVIERGERESKDLNTGLPITYPAVKSIRCKPSKMLRDAVKNKNGEENEEDTL